MTDSTQPQVEQPQRGWRKLLLALVAFVLIPASPLRSFLPVDQAMLLFIPAMAACSLAGWWAGGRAFSAIIWVGLAIFVTQQDIASTTAFASILRGWTLLLAGAFGVMCLLDRNKPFFTRGFAAVSLAFGIAVVMTIIGPMGFAGVNDVIAAEFARRNAEALAVIKQAITDSGAQWQAWVTRMPTLAELPANLEQQLTATSRVGQAMFPALLALQSLAALALAWAVYHRLSRQRIGERLSQLREFRFNDQLVWGLIVGLIILVLPTLAEWRAIGANLVLFFGALYAMRGLGVLAWFMAPGTFAMTFIAGAVLVFVPVVQVVAILGFMTLGVTAVGLGVGDTWADWRSRARSTLS
jgi:hypothetical protein